MMAQNKKTIYHGRGLLALVLVVAAGLLGPSTALAQSCEIPLFVQQGLVGANVMILADNSGSMNAAIYHLDYDVNTIYSGRFNSYAEYYVSKDGLRTPYNFNRLWPNAPSVMLVNSDNGQDGRYSGNYLNWIYFNASPAQRAAVPTVTRIQVLKAVLVDIIDSSQRLNFGLTVFQNNDGGNIIAKCGVNPTSLVATINGLTANTWTPLGESLETILDYYSYDGPDAAIQVACQHNFLLVVTDGLPTMDVNVSGYLLDADGDGNDPGNCTSIGAPYDNSLDCSDHMDDVAWYMANRDLRPDLDGDQLISTYVVGFHENGQLLQDTAINGDGLFFNAENANELAMSIEYSVQDILRRISAGSAVAVVSTERGVDDRLYRGKFMPLDWYGYLESYAMPYVDGAPAIWEAGSILKDRFTSTRRIFTALGDREYDFTDGSAGSLQAAMGAATVDEATALITWGRGDDVDGYRTRQGWILGDIVHSTPVVVGAPAGFTGEQSYQEFYTAHENRRKLVYVGANDGMLHAFDAESGEEAWAFVPEFALPDFAAMADSGYCHVYTCDQTVSVKDVKLNGVWRTILISGGREGSAAIFAMDITYPDSPDVLWQANLPNGKAFGSEVQIISVGGKAVALLGSGLDPDTQEAYLFAYEVETGNLLGSPLISTSKLAYNKATRPAVVDVNLDGQVDVIYVADLDGSLWRAQTNGNPDPDFWDISELYSGKQEITAPPVTAFGANGEVYVYFGTGAYLTETDMMTTDPHSFICVIDKHSGASIVKRDLVDQTNSIGSVDGELGWYVDLWNELGERVTEQAVVVAETVIFTSFAPTQAACVSGGNSYLYQMAYNTGGLPQGDGMEVPEDRSTSLGSGIASYPVVDLAAGTVVVQSSDASILIAPIAAPYQRLTVRSWQESFNLYNPVN
jgi:type IV pilus assembly protein PilY1